jgi:hypothetical protein
MPSSAARRRSSACIGSGMFFTWIALMSMIIACS